MSASECDILKVIYEIYLSIYLLSCMVMIMVMFGCLPCLSPLPVVGDGLFEIVASRIWLGRADNYHRATGRREKKKRNKAMESTKRMS